MGTCGGTICPRAGNNGAECDTLSALPNELPSFFLGPVGGAGSQVAVTGGASDDFARRGFGTWRARALLC